MGLGSPIHWLILLAIVVLVFGTGKLKTLGSDLGSAIKGFKQAMRDGEDEQQQRVDQQKPADDKTDKPA